MARRPPGDGQQGFLKVEGLAQLLPGPRSPDAALAEMRRSSPSLVILDLNCARADPLGTAAAMKREAALAAIPTLGFVSHVQADLIDAARQAGIGEVLARSAFTTRLGEILKRDA